MEVARYKLSGSRSKFSIKPRKLLLIQDSSHQWAQYVNLEGAVFWVNEPRFVSRNGPLSQIYNVGNSAEFFTG